MTGVILQALAHYLASFLFFRLNWLIFWWIFSDHRIVAEKWSAFVKEPVCPAKFHNMFTNSNAGFTPSSPPPPPTWGGGVSLTPFQKLGCRSFNYIKSYTSLYMYSLFMYYHNCKVMLERRLFLNRYLIWTTYFTYLKVKHFAESLVEAGQNWFPGEYICRLKGCSDVSSTIMVDNCQ